MRLSLQAELAADYNQLGGLDAEKQSLDSTVAAYRQAVDLTMNRYNQGVASRVDVVQEQAQAVYDATAASYRQSVLNAIQDVEDNLTALRVLEQENEEQAEAVKLADRSLELALNHYRGGIATCLEVLTAQSSALANRLCF